MTRAFVVLTLLLALAGCREADPAAAAAQVAEMKTLASVDPKPVVLQPPLVLSDEAPPPKPKVQPWETPEPIVLTPEDEKLRASLPFSPAIALDPVDGSKISIRAATPKVELKGRIYYFSSETNKKLFSANPEQYSKGALTQL